MDDHLIIFVIGWILAPRRSNHEQLWMTCCWFMHSRMTSNYIGMPIIYKNAKGKNVGCVSNPIFSVSFKSL